MIKILDGILQLARTKKNRKIVVAGDEEESILASINAFREKIANFIFVGNEKKIKDFFKQERISSSDFEIIEEKGDEKISKKAVEILKEGKGDILLKAGVRTDILLKAFFSIKEFKTGRILSDCLVAPDPLTKGERIIGVADGGVNVLPKLFEKKQIIENSVSVFQKLGFSMPKVAILSATEKVSSAISSTIDAEKLVELNKIGEIKNCIVEGPYALDNALSKWSAEKKQILGDVAGCADILIVPNIEAGNILGKAIMYFCNYDLAHVIVGAKVPILIPSRSESVKSKLYSIGLGVLCCE